MEAPAPTAEASQRQSPPSKKKFARPTHLLVVGVKSTETIVGIRYLWNTGASEVLYCSEYSEEGEARLVPIGSFEPHNRPSDLDRHD